MPDCLDARFFFLGLKHQHNAFFLPKKRPRCSLCLYKLLGRFVKRAFTIFFGGVVQWGMGVGAGAGAAVT
jgi:hypothetical protein